MDPFHLIHNEVSGDADPGAGDSDDAGTTGETDSAEAWSGPSKEEWEATQAQLAEYQAAMAGEDEEGEYEEDEEGIDLFADDAAEKLLARLEQRLDERLGPVASYTERLQMEEAEELAKDIIADLEAKDGEFMNPEKSRPLARLLADQHWPTLIQKFPNSPAGRAKAAEAALAQGVKEARELEQVYGEAYYNRKMNNLRGLAGAKTEPGASGREGASQQVTPEGGDELSLVSHHLGR